MFFFDFLFFVFAGHGDTKVNGDVGIAATTITVREDADIVQSGGNSQDNPVRCVNQQSGMPSALSGPSAPAIESTEEMIRRVRSGWSSDNANALTVGELYLMVSSSFLQGSLNNNF